MMVFLLKLIGLEVTFLPQISFKQLDDISLHIKAARELISIWLHFLLEATEPNQNKNTNCILFTGATIKPVVFVTQETFLFSTHKKGVFGNWLFIIPYQNLNILSRMLLETAEQHKIQYYQ